MQSDVMEWVVKVGERMFPLFLKSGVRGREFRKGRERGATLVEFAGMAIVVAILIGGGYCCRSKSWTRHLMQYFLQDQ